MRPWIALLAACHAPHATSPDAALSDARTADASAAPPSWGERCGNGSDDDGDGLVDEDCPPSLFAGAFAPNVAADPALAEIEAATGRPLAVVQTYRATKPGDAAYITRDLAAIFARGQVAHLNVEPAGYTRAQYGAPAQDPLAGDLAGVGR